MRRGDVQRAGRRRRRHRLGRAGGCGAHRAAAGVGPSAHPAAGRGARGRAGAAAHVGGADALLLPHLGGRRDTPATALATEPDNPFEREVCAALRAHGFETVPKVGCAGYFIDLAVVDENRPGHYLLGIECDGPNYQTARTARDRDRLRSEVLRKMGWQLHRIWSADWIHRYDDELAKLIAAVNRAQEQVLSPNELSPPVATPPSPDILAETFEAALTTETDPAETSTPKLDAVPTASTASTASFVAEPYTVASLPASPQLDINNRAHMPPIAGLVNTVVASESPVHRVEVCRRVGAALGVGRVTESFQTRLEAAIGYAERVGAVRRNGEFLWRADQTHAPLRTRAGTRLRNIALIAPEEIERALTTAVTLSYGIAETDLARAASSLLGFERLTADTRDRIDAVARGMVGGGRLAVNGGVVTAVDRAATN